MTIASHSVLARRARYGAWLGVVVALSSLPAQASDQITFVSQGGAYQKAQTVAILDPAAKKLDITVNQDSIPDAWPVIKTQVASGKPTWDVVDVPTGYCLRGGEQGLIEKLDFAKLPNAAAMPENYRSPYSVAYEFYSSVLAYSQTKYPAGAAPDSWADFWDVKKFPGSRCFYDRSFSCLAFALLADGVPADKLYPMDVDRAFRKMSELKPHIKVWWREGSQSQQLIRDGEVDMIAMWSARAVDLIEDKVPLELVWNEAEIYYANLQIPKGDPNAPATWEFCNFVAQAKPQSSRNVRTRSSSARIRCHWIRSDLPQLSIA